MEKILNFTFDFFNYAIPGTCIILCFFMLDPRINTIGDFLIVANSIQSGAATLIAIVGYLLGFAINPIGRFLYKSIGFKIWKPKFKDISSLSISDKYALIRELAPNNFKYVETWNMLTGMSHNLALCCLIAVFILLTRAILLPIQDFALWIGLLLTFCVLFFLFIHRAVVYFEWAANDINSTINKLDLEKKGLAKTNI